MACHGQPAHGLGLAHDNRALWVTGTSKNKRKTRPTTQTMRPREITSCLRPLSATLGSFQNALIFRLLLRITVERITTSDFPSFWRGATLVPINTKAISQRKDPQQQQLCDARIRDRSWQVGVIPCSGCIAYHMKPC